MLKSSFEHLGENLNFRSRSAPDRRKIAYFRRRPARGVIDGAAMTSAKAYMPGAKRGGWPICCRRRAERAPEIFYLLKRA